MPHFFSNRPRALGLFHKEKEADAHHHFRWETINAVVYLFGGAVFVLGSIFCFPAFSDWQDLGSTAFLFGSVLYLLVTGHDFAEVMKTCSAGKKGKNLRQRLDLSAAFAYLAGTILFTIGSAFFLSEIAWIEGGAWCFLVGSALFVAGAVINVLQIVFAANMKTLQLLNLTAISFVIGSVLFCVASVPYLWSLESRADRYILGTYLAWLFVIGSALFVLGGTFNYWRAWLVARRALEKEAEA